MAETDGPSPEDRPKTLDALPDELHQAILLRVPQVCWPVCCAVCSSWSTLTHSHRDEFVLARHATPTDLDMALRALRRAKQRPARQLRITGLPVASLGLEDLGALQSAALSWDLHELTLAGRPGRRPQRTGALTSVLQSLADTQHEALATLDLSWTDAVGSEELAAALAHAPSLTALSLCGCSRIDGAFVHEHVLPLAPQLRVLGLSCCELLDGTAVAPVVRHCPAIEVLELSGVRIGVCAASQTASLPLHHWIDPSPALRRIHLH